MSDYTKVIIESDDKGRINISALDDEYRGHGYRLAGPKYNTGGGKQIAKVELDERDVKEIRSYLAIWDEIQAAKAATQGVAP